MRPDCFASKSQKIVRQQTERRVCVQESCASSWWHGDASPDMSACQHGEHSTTKRQQSNTWAMNHARSSPVFQSLSHWNTLLSTHTLPHSERKRNCVGLHLCKGVSQGAGMRTCVHARARVCACVGTGNGHVCMSFSSILLQVCFAFSTDTLIWLTRLDKS